MNQHLAIVPNAPFGGAKWSGIGVENGHWGLLGFTELQTVNMEPSDLSQPGMAERAIDTATDVSRTITEASAALRVAVDCLSNAIATARQPGKPLATIAAITREAPLASLFVAFLFGVAVARRR